MNIKVILISGISVFLFFALLIFSIVLISDEETEGSIETYTVLNLSSEVLAHKPMVEKYCKKYGIEDCVMYLLAIMEVESGGIGNDVMQASESLGLPVNTLSVEASIEQGCKYFYQLLSASKEKGCDMNTSIQSYNFGGGFIDYVASKGKKYTYELAESFSREKSGGVKVDYKNPIAISMNGGWRYNYGNQFYIQLVSQYLLTAAFDDETVKVIVNEALKYKGKPYVFGGATPETSFDCSGLTQWCYGKAGIKLPRTAQAQYEVTQHMPLSEAKPGDLVFFHSTYYTSDYITHVGILVGPNRIFHAGDSIGYADLNTPYWQQHLVGAGRVIER